MKVWAAGWAKEGMVRSVARPRSEGRCRRRGAGLLWGLLEVMGVVPDGFATVRDGEGTTTG